MTPIRACLVVPAALLLSLAGGTSTASAAPRCPGLISMSAALQLQNSWNRQTIQPPPAAVDRAAPGNFSTQRPQPIARQRTTYTRPTHTVQTRTQVRYTPVRLTERSQEMRTTSRSAEYAQSHRSTALHLRINTRMESTRHTEGTLHVRFGWHSPDGVGRGPGRPRIYPWVKLRYESHSYTTTSMRHSISARSSTRTTQSRKLSTRQSTERTERSRESTALRRSVSASKTVLRRPGARKTERSKEQSRPVTMRNSSPPLKRATSRPLDVAEKKVSGLLKLSGQVRCGACHQSTPRSSSRPTELRAPQPLLVKSPGPRLLRSSPPLLQQPPPYQLGSRRPILTATDLVRPTPVNLPRTSLAAMLQAPPSRPRAETPDRTPPSFARTPESESMNSTLMEILRPPDSSSPRSVDVQLSETVRDPELALRSATRLRPEDVLATPSMLDVDPTEAGAEERAVVLTLVEMVLQTPTMIGG
jgi:hypothetical protein